MQVLENCAEEFIDTGCSERKIPVPKSTNYHLTFTSDFHEHPELIEDCLPK